MRLCCKAKRSMFIIFALSVFINISPAKTQAQQLPLQSKTVASTFHDLASDLLNTPGISDSQIDQAMIFLFSASKLDPKSKYIYETILNAAPRLSAGKYDAEILQAFDRYVSSSSDLEVTRKAVLYLLSGLNSRQQRQKVLTKLLNTVGDRNPALNSQLSTQLGLLAAETADFSTARKYLYRAFRDDRYNYRAFSGLDQLLEDSRHAMPPAHKARHLLTQMIAKPFDLNSALGFARYAELISIAEPASRAYQYSAQLYSYNNPGYALPPSIYLPWVITCYNAPSRRADCLKILDEVRKTSAFDIVLEAIAGRAALKSPDKKIAARGARILDQAAMIAEEKLNASDGSSSDVTYLQLAWFYAVAYPDPDKALLWANKARLAGPDSSHAKALFSYAVLVNNNSVGISEDKIDLAGKFLTEDPDFPLYKTDQIAAIAMSSLHLSDNQKADAGETLNLGIDMSPLSLAAEKAKQMLKDNSLADKSVELAQRVSDSLEIEFGKDLVPVFVRPEDFISTKLILSDIEADFITPLEARLIIANKRTHPLVIFDRGLFKGNIRVDAKISGDLKAYIPELISKTVMPSAAIKGGHHASIPLKLMTGSLKGLLTTHPQASVEIEFTVYLDPVLSRSGALISSVKDAGKLKATVRRRRVKLSNRYLMDALADLSKGKPSSKVRASKLFAGLYFEQYSKTSPCPYRYETIERSLLTGAISSVVDDADFNVSVPAIASVLNLRPPVDYRLTKAVSKRLEDPYWPVRMAALYFLSNFQGENFKPVLDWKAARENNPDVRRLALELGGEGNK